MVMVHSPDKGAVIAEDHLDLRSVGELEFLVDVPRMLHGPVAADAPINTASVRP